MFQLAFMDFHWILMIVWNSWGLIFDWMILSFNYGYLMIMVLFW